MYLFFMHEAIDYNLSERKYQYDNTPLEITLQWNI